ncbi:MAG: branched-chain amino acid ABC transporter permease [Acidobacteriota bacterium]
MSVRRGQPRASRRLIFRSALGLAILLIVPVLLGEQSYRLHLATLCLLYVCLASAWNLLGGFTGQISFGHAALFGLGAYTTAILWLRGFAPLSTMPLAGLIAAAFAILWGWPCLRLRGPYFAIATIGVGEATRILMNNLEATGGSSGLALPTPGTYSMLPHYYLALVLASMAVGLSVWVSRSRFGLGLLAIREDIEAAESLGVPTARYQLYALALSSFLVGLGGSFYAQFIFYIVPEKVFGFDFSISMILMTIIGGLGTVAGPVIGATLFLLLEQFVLVRFSSLHLGSFGVLLIGLVLFEPRGLAGLFERFQAMMLGRSSRGAS